MAGSCSEAQSFSEAQKQAITHLEGPAMVLAGPGSGKTTVITERVRFLIQDAGVDPASVLVVTFTKAAATEMKSRFLKLTGKASTAVSFGTFHSIFFSILRAAYHYTSADVISEKERMLLFREIIEELGLEIDDPADFIRNVSGEVGMVKGDHIDPANYYAMNCADDVFRQIYAAYQQKLVRSRKIDFEDMLIYTMDLFTKRPDILAAWQRKFCWILVDEFQDINRLQYEIIRMLALPENNLFIVGDDDQSIYRFRGAKPEIMLGFPKDYPKTRQILLDINYRCPGPVVSCSKRVIEHNQKRYAKALKAIRPAGERVDICGFENIAKECQAVIDRIRIYHEGAIPYNQIAVLYRINTDARMLATKLMEYTIPFRMRDSIPNIFEHWIARDIISYIKIACDKADRSDYLRALNRPLRYISRKAISEAIYKAENQMWAERLESMTQIGGSPKQSERNSTYIGESLMQADRHATYVEENPMQTGGSRMQSAADVTHIAAGGTQMAAGRTEIAAGGIQIAAGGTQMPAGQTQMAAGGTQIAAGGTQMPAGQTQMAAGGIQIAAGGTQIPAGGTQMAAGGIQIAAGGTQIAAGGTQIAAGGTQMPAGQTQTSAGGMRISAGYGDHTLRLASGFHVPHQSVLGELETFYKDKDWMAERLQELGKDLKNISAMQPYAAVTYIRYAVDYDTYLVNYAKDRRIQEGDLLEIVSDICESAKNYQTFDEWFAYMDTYAKLLEEKRRHRQDTEPVDGVVLSTIHSAKGLEYQVVFVIDANEGVMPHKKAVMDVDVEEERRLFYVAMTRAKERLHIYYTRERYQKPAQASRFVDEIRGRSRSKKGHTQKRWRKDESI